MANNDWQTPDDIFAAFDDRFNFVIDLAASPQNAKCSRFITREQNSLSMDWAQLVGNRWGWLNCPYDNPLPWVTHSVLTQRNGSGVVMLLNNDCSVRWFRRGINAASEIWHFVSNDEDKPNYRNGRIGFVDPATGIQENSGKKPQLAFIFDPHRIGDQQTKYVELDAFERHGQAILAQRTMEQAA